MSDLIPIEIARPLKGRLQRYIVPDGSILADSIGFLPHLAAWNQLFKVWFEEKDYSQLLMYLIDHVAADALSFLAWQFDALGYEGWRLATNDEQKRAVIKNAIELHKYKGTPYAVKEALKSVGFGDAVLEEGVEGHWANFRFTLDLGERPLNEDEISLITGMVYAYKNTRSHLVDISYKLSFIDTVRVQDAAMIEPGQNETDGVIVGALRLCDGTYLCDGSIDCSKDADVVIWTEL